MWFLLCLFATLPDPMLKVEVVRSYGEVTGKTDVFLQGPGDLTLDDQGRLHVLDLRARNVLVWDKQGKYIGSYGKPGQGPGELQINGTAGGPQGYISAIGDTLYIYDGGARRLSLFNNDMSFREAIPFNIEGGRVEVFRPLGKDAFLVFNSSYFSDVPFRRVAIFNRAKTSEQQVLKVPDTTWRYSGSGNDRKVELQAYAPSLQIAVNEATGKVALGDGGKTAFDLYDFKGKKLKSVEVKLVRKEVTKEAKEEFSAQNWIKQSNGFFTAAFPERRAFYDRLLAVGKDRYLLFLVSPVKGNVDGYLVNEAGETLGRFTYACGEGGALYTSRGRLFTCRTNEDGDFTVEELLIGGKASLPTGS